MISRRELLGSSLTVCSCAASGGFEIDALAFSAHADSPTAIKGTGYDLWFIGAQRETIMNGKLAAALDLRTLASRPHLYGIGPMEQLRGEVTIANSRRALARVASDGTVKVIPSFETGVPFFVWAEVPLWHQVPIPAGVRSFEELESFVPKAAAAAGLDADKPLPFLVDGRERLIEFHIVNRIGDGPHNMEMHKKIQVPFELKKAEATIVGFHSTKHRGTFTPGDSNIHVHFQTPDNMKSGHIQKLQLGDGAVLSLPVSTA
jgi:alpha-acetolactate decarboxylase